MTLGQWTQASQSDSAIASIIHTLASTSANCAVALRTSEVTKAKVPKGAAQNAFGDDVLSVDLICDKIIADGLRADHNVAAFASEEVPTLQKTNNVSPAGGGGFTVAFDPLDGSSIIGSNFAVGSIFGIWKGDYLVGQKVSDQHCAAITVFGPRTTFFVASRDDSKTPGVAQFMLNHEKVGESRLVGIHKIKPVARVFAPGNLRSANQLPWYKEILKKHLTDETTLRYSGGMVPDVAQIFVKGHGIFMTPRTPAHKVKLRVCLSVAPSLFWWKKEVGNRLMVRAASWIGRLPPWMNVLLLHWARVRRFWTIRMQPASASTRPNTEGRRANCSKKSGKKIMLTRLFTVS